MVSELTPEFVDKHLLALTTSAGLLLAVGGGWIVVFVLGARYRSAITPHGESAQRQLRLLGEGGEIAPFILDVRTGEFQEHSIVLRLLGYDALDRERRPWNAGLTVQRVHREDRRQWIAALRDCVRSGRLDHEARFLGFGGAIMHVAVRADLERDATGVPLRLVGVCRDVTLARRLGQELAECRARGYHLARISDLGAMTAAIGHELRQPLTAILCNAGAAQVYLTTLPWAQPQIMDLLAGIVHDSQQAKAIIHRILARSRRDPVPFQLVNLDALVRETLRNLQHSPVVGRTHITLKLGETLPDVRGDSVQLQQLLGNLITNAAEAMARLPAERRSLTVVTYSEVPGEASLAVIDRGTGIAPAVQAKLFLPFITSKPDGHGIGLWMCRDIAVSHGGTLTGANNDDGPGAVFTLTLPTAGLGWNSNSETHEDTPENLCRR